MKLTRRSFMQAAPALPATLLLPKAASGQTSARPIRWLVGFPAGSGTDVSVRIIAEVAGRILGQTFVVENRPGASGTLAAAALRSFPADGNTIYSMEMGAYSLAPHFLPSLGYDSVRDFRMVSTLVVIPMVLMVPTSLNVSTVSEFVNLLKAHGPNHFQFGSSGAGSITHVTMAAFLREAGVSMEHVPYRGTTFTVTDLAAGRIAAGFTDANTPFPFMQTGQLKMIAVAMPDRLAAQPTVPTLREAGMALDLPYWQGVAVLRATPDAMVNRINDALNRAISDPQVISKLAEIGMLTAAPRAPEAADEFARNGFTAVRDKLRELGLETQ
ncbi:Bug family tripartite tricarboxylate transporter substrate binding protein [Falsiroseomonas sp.]|uniref:Bug family tripartite tricarboxylate transporter substrate binding protein n=1 Tax=Falsiroseomonas sp. TaxID=2870721 RepID=UPI003F7168D7